MTKQKKDKKSVSNTVSKTKSKIGKSTKKTTKTRSHQKDQKRISRGQLLPFWRLFMESVQIYWAVKKQALVLFVAHAILIVFVISDEVLQTDIQVYTGLVVSLLISMMYISLLREASKKTPKPQLENVVFDGPSQVIAFSTLLALTIIQIIPFAFGALVFQIAITSNIAILLWEQIAFGVLWFILSTPSMYWISTTLMALIVVTIPKVRPSSAWQAAKQLVRGFTFQVAWRISLFLIIYMAILVGAVVGSFAVGREVFSLQIPNYSIAVLIPMFWGYSFALYRDLLSYDKKRS